VLLVDQLRMMADALPGEVAYEQVDAGRITFAEWEQESNRLARGLVASGIVAQDRVCIFLAPEESLRWLVTYAAIHKAGAVAVPVNTRLAHRELEYVLGHAGAKVVMSGGEALREALALGSSVPSIEQVISTGLPEGGPPPRPGAGGAARTEGCGRAPLRLWDEVLDDDPSSFQVPVSSDDLADIMYTSGTTGTPKGVAVRHRNSAMMPNAMPRWTGSGWLHASPLFTFAGIASVYNPMKLGMKGIYMPRFDAERWIRLVEEERPAAMFLVPAMAQLLIRNPRFETADMTSVSLCSVGAAPLPPATLRRLQEKMLGASVTSAYGLTEAGPAFCTMPRGESLERVGSVGKPVPPMEVRAVDETGRDVPTGEVGEILIRLEGRQREYYNDPEATARTWTADGWLRTGDLGRLDEDGYLYIVGRKKDVIIRGGNNVYATDVEAVLLEHPDVAEAAVVGVPHEVLGEDVAAYVVTSRDLAEEELARFARERLADYKVPRTIHFVGSLPRNATGKVKKHELGGTA
jgi:acyl-CoA synthetase (AMP-forming)/AMP-acid ligase II